MADVSPGVGFVAMTPCRVVDTRGGGVFTGTYGPPALVGNAAARSFDINSAPHCTGIPAGAEAYSLNFTLIAAAGVFQNAFLTAWPTGAAQPVVSTLNFNAGQLEANAAVVPAGTNGSINVFVNAPGHLLIDINGYFTDEYNPGVTFEASSAGIAPAILGENTSTVADAVAIRGVVTSTTPGASSAAVRGINNGTGGSGIGVWGSQNGSGFGVYGTSPTGYGVYGLSTSGFGVVADGGSGGVWATTAGASANGVFGQHTGSGNGVVGWSQTGNGVVGRTLPGTFDSNRAGVLGWAGGLVLDNDIGDNAGVRGESASHIGVLGLTSNGAPNSIAVFGRVPASVAGALGFDSGVTDWGVYSFGNAHVQGTFTASANKGFVQPHPHDASKEIRYISLEGPHTEVYFRGTAQVSQGVTRIPIPEHFRFVADPATYSTLVTPVGAMATVAVVSEGPEGIVVQASRDVKVHYVVYAEREAVRNPDPIIENVHFRPDPKFDFFAHLPVSFRQLMIQNGTLNADGTVNMETAKRLGWDKEWEKSPRPARQTTD